MRSTYREKNDFDEPPADSKRELDAKKLKEQIESLKLKNQILRQQVQEQPKNKNGRPEKYSPEFHPLLAQLFYAQGGIDVDFATYIGVTEPTIHNWRKRYPEFKDAITEGKLNPDIKMEAALYKSGIEGSNTAQIYWLKNRRPERWRDQSHLELTGKDGGPIVTRQERKEKLEELMKKHNGS